LYPFRIIKGFLKSRVKGHIMVAVGADEVISVQQYDCPALVHINFFMIVRLSAPLKFIKRIFIRCFG